MDLVVYKEKLSYDQTLTNEALDAVSALERWLFLIGLEEETRIFYPDYKLPASDIR